MRKQSGTPAGIGRRLGAIVYDSILIVAIWVMSLVIVVISSQVTDLSEPVVATSTVQLLCAMELFAFFYFFWLYRGRTLGMLVWHTHLAVVNEEQLRARHVVLRFTGACLCFASLGLGYIWILFDGNNRSWSDLISGTCVLND